MQTIIVSNVISMLYAADNFHIGVKQIFYNLTPTVTTISEYHILTTEPLIQTVHKFRNNKLTPGIFASYQKVIADKFILGLEVGYTYLGATDNSSTVDYLIAPVMVAVRAMGAAGLPTVNYVRNLKLHTRACQDILVKFGYKLSNATIYLKSGYSFMQGYLSSHIYGPSYGGNPAPNSYIKNKLLIHGITVGVGTDIPVSNKILLSFEYSHSFYPNKRINNAYRGPNDDPRQIFHNIKTITTNFAIKLSYIC